MYAVIKTGGKQYKVAPGHTLRIEKIKAEAGTSIDFKDVLMVAKENDIRIGSPQVDGGKVTATVLEHGRDKKVTILKFKRRKHHLKRQGHRQYYTDVKIIGIAAEGIEEIWEPKPKVAPVETTSSETETVPSPIESQKTEEIPSQNSESQTTP